MKFIEKTIFITLFLLTSGCANYVNKLHRQFDEGLGTPPSPQQQKDNFALYRQKQKARNRQLISTRNNPQHLPQTKRNYGSSTIRKRYKADDLNDNGSDGSLWTSKEGQSNYLFTDNNKKTNGDIVLIKVFDQLKGDITAELKRAFPSPVRKSATAQTKTGAKKEAPGNKKSEEGDDKPFDRISSVVIEEIKKDHLLLRGRKSLIFQKRKRLVEVQALISRRDVLDDDTVSSTQIIESNVSVIR